MSHSKMKAVVLGHALALAIGVAAPSAFAQPYPPPPPEYIATAAPVYFEGHAAYWYQGHWHYRDEHGAWAYYHDEPPFLAERRRQAPPERRSYAPPRRAPAPAPRGGGDRGRR